MRDPPPCPRARQRTVQPLRGPGDVPRAHTAGARPALGSAIRRGGGSETMKLALVLFAAYLLAVAATAAHTTRPSPPPTVERALRLAEAAYGVQYRELAAVAWCESRYAARAVGKAGDTGLFQFLASTWRGTPFRGFSRFDPAANALAAAWLVSRDGSWRQWT